MVEDTFEDASLSQNTKASEHTTFEYCPELQPVIDENGNEIGQGKRERRLTERFETTKYSQHTSNNKRKSRNSAKGRICRVWHYSY